MVASVRRDNGILAMDYDLFAVAKRNLESAVSQRPDDASAHFYLAKLERLTARTPGERQDAISHLTMLSSSIPTAAPFRQLIMEYAVALIEEGDPANKDQIYRRIEGLCGAFRARSRGIAGQHAADLRLHERGRRLQVVSAAAMVRRAVDQQPGLHDHGAGSGDPQGIDAGGPDAVRASAGYNPCPRRTRQGQASEAGNSTGEAPVSQGQHACGELEDQRS